MHRAEAIYLRSLAEEEDFWKQKARNRWLQVGDKNTSFFHSSITTKRAKLAIHKIKTPDGTLLEGIDDIRAHTVDYFQQLFHADDHAVQADIEAVLSSIPHLVTVDHNQSLLRPVELEEVRTAVFQLDPDSAPSSDGFTGRFFQSSWEIIASDFYIAVMEFFAGVSILKSISGTLIVLIPNTQNPKHLADYRPISLCNFINKVLTRILCDRLRGLLSHLISEAQSAFVPRRDIANNVLLAQKLVQHLHKKVRGHNVIFKFNMLKAFDRVS